MKGLFLNNYYSAQDGIKISMLISALISILTIFVDDSVATGALGLIIFIFPTNNVSSLQADEASKWNKFEITTPVSRYQIILAKYIGYFGTIAIGVICSIAVIIIMFCTGRQLNFDTLLYPILFGVSLSLLMGAILYPLLLKAGALKAELFTVISAILSIAIIFAIWSVINTFFFTIDFKSVTTGTVACIFSILFFFGSFLLSNRIYHKKEF